MARTRTITVPIRVVLVGLGDEQHSADEARVSPVDNCCGCFDRAPYTIPPDLLRAYGSAMSAELADVIKRAEAPMGGDETAPADPLDESDKRARIDANGDCWMWTGKRWVCCIDDPTDSLRGVHTTYGPLRFADEVTP